MARLTVSVSGGYITADVETNGAVLEAALQDDKAEPVMRCAVLMALSALAEGGAWPNTALQSMASFMARMNNELVAESPEDGAGTRRAASADRAGAGSQRSPAVSSAVARKSGRRVYDR